MPHPVPAVLQVVAAVVPAGWMNSAGKFVVPVPPVRMVPFMSSGDTEAAPLPVTTTSGAVAVPVKVGEAMGADRVAELATQVEHVPVRFVMRPDAGVPSAGATSVVPVGSIRLGSSEITGVVVPVATSI